jgi:hypothetical protein
MQATDRSPAAKFAAFPQILRFGKNENRRPPITGTDVGASRDRMVPIGSSNVRFF